MPNHQTVGMRLASVQVASTRGDALPRSWWRRAVVALWFILLAPVLVGLALAWVVAAVLAAIWVGIGRLVRAVLARAE
jgi:hypothetical protein